MSGCLGRTTVAPEEITETVSRSVLASDFWEVRVRNAVGNVLITAQGTGDVDVSVRKRSSSGRAGLDDLTADIDLDDGTLTVETKLDSSALVSTRRTPTVDVTVTVPETPSPEISAVSSETGDVTLLGTRGDTVVRTGIGDVIASDADGSFPLSSRTGTIVASDIAGLTAISTEIGLIKADVLGVRDDIEISSDIGDVTLGIADGLDPDIVAETNGSLDANLPVTDGRTERFRFTGRLNAGGTRYVRSATSVTPPCGRYRRDRDRPADGGDPGPADIAAEGRVTSIEKDRRTIVTAFISRSCGRTSRKTGPGCASINLLLKKKTVDLSYFRA